MENTASIPFWAEPSPKKGICGLRAVGMLVCSHGIYMAEAAAHLRKCNRPRLHTLLAPTPVPRAPNPIPLPACKDQVGSRERLHLRTSSGTHSTAFFEGNVGKLSARPHSQPFSRYGLFNMSSMPCPSFGPTRGRTGTYLWSIGNI